MISVLDQGIGKVMSALRETGMIENSVVVFFSDNGGPTIGIHNTQASNYPLKGVGFNNKLKKFFKNS